jgi:hypothetical protein
MSDFRQAIAKELIEKHGVRGRFWYVYSRIEKYATINTKDGKKWMVNYHGEWYLLDLPQFLDLPIARANLSASDIHAALGNWQSRQTTKHHRGDNKVTLVRSATTVWHLIQRIYRSITIRSDMPKNLRVNHHHWTGGNRRSDCRSSP